MIGFIFIHSLMNADDSAQESGSLLLFINGILKSLGTGIVLTDHMIRKAAHFTEFFTLGTLLVFTVYTYTKKTYLLIILPLFIGVSTACLDEFIQTFAVGRSGQLSDVLLDSAGTASAVFIIAVIMTIIRNHQKKRETEIE